MSRGWQGKKHCKQIQIIVMAGWKKKSKQLKGDTHHKLQTKYRQYYSISNVIETNILVEYGYTCTSAPSLSSMSPDTVSAITKVTSSSKISSYSLCWYFRNYTVMHLICLHAVLRYTKKLSLCIYQYAPKTKLMPCDSHCTCHHTRKNSKAYFTFLFGILGSKLDYTNPNLLLFPFFPISIGTKLRDRHVHIDYTEYWTRGTACTYFLLILGLYITCPWFLYMKW